jgi:LacI family transcriptional regulator
LEEAGIPVSKEMILVGDFKENSGYLLAKELLLRRSRPSAILVSNGVMAWGVLQAFEELGVHCPEDVAIAAFDDLIGDRAFHPRLTVVSQPGYEIGALGVSLLMDRIEGKVTKKPAIIRVPPSLVVRESTRSRVSPERNIPPRKSDSYEEQPIGSS